MTHLVICSRALAFWLNNSNSTTIECIDEMVFLRDPNQTTTSSDSIPWWEKILGILTLGIMNAVIAIVSNAIQNATESVVGSKTATALGEVAPGLVVWTGQLKLNIVAGGIQDNYYMQGKLVGNG